MDNDGVKTAITQARLAAQGADDYKSETYLAVLLTELLRSRSEGISPIPNGTSAIVKRSDYDLEKLYSPGELFANKSWSSAVDKVAIVGHFLERYRGLPSYTIEEIRKCLILAKVSAPKNVNLPVFQAVQRGLMMEVPSEDGGKKAWALTQAGVRYVEEMKKAES